MHTASIFHVFLAFCFLIDKCRVMVIIPGYKVRERIHEGSRTVIYRGYHVASKRPVILKCLKPEQADSAAIAQLQREYTLTQHLHCDGVVRCYGLEQHDESVVLVLEDFGGVPLHHLKTSKTPPGVDVLQIGIQLAETLGCLHRQHVIHKDIKPGNVLIHPATGKVKVSDLSIAVYQLPTYPSLSSSSAQQFAGTLAYMSPEQTGRMHRAVDYRTDFYSLGVTLYELLTGFLPFEASDPMELVHAHIAREPLDPAERYAAVPPALSAIILKLLAKTAEDRYQSAAGLKADLEFLRDHLPPVLARDGGLLPYPPKERLAASAGQKWWEEMEALKDFTPGAQDVADSLHLSQQLYGRKAEVATLQAAFARVRHGAKEAVLVTGTVGIGKSKLVREFSTPVLQDGGYFLSGKFDQLRHTIPYSAVIQAFQALVVQRLAAPEAEVVRWRVELLAALEPNGQVMNEVLPELELVIGPQPTVPELTSAEAQNRFMLTFRRFIQVCARPEHPLVLFLDDLQWADDATLTLLESLLLEPDIQYLLIVGTYRESEVNEEHPLAKMLNALQQAEEATVQMLALQPLQEEHVRQFIADSLRCPVERVAPLANLLVRKTGGNPFFVTHLLKSLVQDGLLWFDAVQRGWQWELADIQTAGMTDDVVELVSATIHRLAPETHRVLALAACIGNHFDVRLLSAVVEHLEEETVRLLQPALQEGLILPHDNSAGSYTFLHDRVQQAAYALLDEQQRQATHVRISQLLLQTCCTTEQDERLFDVVNHLLAGRDLLNTPTEQEEAATLLLKAGRKATFSAAYEAAREFFCAGIELLPSNCWHDAYELTLALYTEATETALVTIQFDQAEQFSTVILEHAQTLLDTVKVYETRIRFASAQGQFLLLVERGLYVLEMLGITLSDESPLIQHPELTTAEGIAALRDLPIMDDPYHLAAMRIFMLILPPMYHARPDLFPSATYTVVNLCISSGNSPLAALAYSSYGMLLCAQNEIEMGYRFGQVALEIMERLNPQELKAKRISLFELGIRHWKEHARGAIQPLLEGVQACLDVGDIERAGYNALHYCRFLFAVGESLEFVAQQQATYLSLTRKLKQEVNSQNLLVDSQVVLNLLAPGESSEYPACPLAERMLGPLFDEEQMLPDLLAAQNTSLLFAVYAAKTFLCYLFEQHAQAVKHARLAEQYENAARLTHGFAMYTFHYALALLAQYATIAPEEQSYVLDQIAIRQQRLALWTTHAPMNYQHKHDLVAAEYARVLGNVAEAMELYDHAIEGAHHQGYIQEEALANELAARFYLLLGRERIAHVYLQEAHYQYMRWGATAKVRQLEERYAHVLSQQQTELPEITTTTSSPASSKSGMEPLDVTTVAKAARALSSEIVLDTLLETFLHIAIENAGAQRGFLLLEKQGNLVLEAQGRVEHDTILVHKTMPLEAEQYLSAAVVNYVRRTHEGIVMSDASGDERFASDAYIGEHTPKSLICLPLLNRGKLNGVLYLENNLMVGAFTTQHLTVMRMLASQAAISLENARLYSDMKQEIAERRRVEQILMQRMRVAALGEDVGAALTHSHTLQDMLQRCVESIAHHLDAAFAGIWMLDQVAQMLTVQATAGLRPTHLAETYHSIPVGTFKMGQIVLSRQPYLTNDAQHDPDIQATEWFKQEHLVSYAAYPLIVEDEMMGVMIMLARHQLTELTIEALASTAHGIAIAMQRVQSEEALRESEKQLRLLYEQLEDYSRNLEQKVSERTHEIERRRQVAERVRDILKFLNSNRSLDEILDYIVAEGALLMETHSAAIYQFQREQEAFVLQSSCGLPAAFTQHRLCQASGSFVEQAVLNRQPVMYADLATAANENNLGLDADQTALLLQYYQTLLAVPLIRQRDSEESDEAYGGITLFYPNQRDFSEEDIGLAVAFADQAALAIENARLRQQVERAAIIEERARLARELHDSVTQSLYSLTLLAEGWRRLANDGRLPNVGESLAELGNIGQQALKEMRLLVHELRPPVLESEGWLAALHQRLGAVERRSGVEARLLADDVVDLPTRVEEGLYRIVQEALNNSLKHASATSVTVRVLSDACGIEVIVADDGVGFDVDAVSDMGGMGLVSMRERAERLGGTLAVETSAGAGTKVVMRVPLDD